MVKHDGMRISGAEAVLLLILGTACSGGNVARVADACGLLTREEIAVAVVGTVGEGELVRAIGEDRPNICRYAVDGPAGHVSIYLGEGQPRDASAGDPGTAFNKTEGVYVSVSAQFPAPGFDLVVAGLADHALRRATRG